MSLAQALMTKHAIDESRLGAVGQTTERVVNRVFTMPAPYSKAKAYGFSLVACAVGLKTVNLPARRSVPGLKEWRLHVFGYESDVEFFDFLLASLMRPDDEGRCPGLRRNRSDLLDLVCHGVLQRRADTGCKKPARPRSRSRPTRPVPTSCSRIARSSFSTPDERPTRYCARAHRSAPADQGSKPDAIPEPEPTSAGAGSRAMHAALKQ